MDEFVDKLCDVVGIPSCGQMSKHQKENRPPPYPLFLFRYGTKAWKNFDAVSARSIWSCCTATMASTTAALVIPSGQAPIALKISKTTVSRALTSLQRHGFIVAEKRGVFHCKDRHASEYRLTAYHSDIAKTGKTEQPTKEFLRWPEIQITVPVVKRTGSVTQLRCPSGETVSSNKGDNCPSGETVEVIRYRAQSHHRYTYSLPGA